MRFSKKMIFGLLGMAFGGPIGLLVGLWIGHAMDKRAKKNEKLARDFSNDDEVVAVAVVVLAAKLAKADGRVSEKEIKVFKGHFEGLGEAESHIARIWKLAVESNDGFARDARRIAGIFHNDLAMLERIYMMLETVAEADGGILPVEQEYLRKVAEIFGFGDLGYLPGKANMGSFRFRASSADRTEKAFREIFQEMPADTMVERVVDRAESSVQSWRGFRDWCEKGFLSRPEVRPIAATFVFIAVFIFSLLADFLPVHSPVPDGVYAGILGIVGGIVTWLALPNPYRLRDEIAAAAKAANLDVDEVVTAVKEARSRIASIRRLATRLDKALEQRIESIAVIAGRIIDSFKKDPRDFRRARRFLGHYLVATEDLLRRFTELKSDGASSERLDKVYAKFEPVLADIEQVFQQQFESSFNDEALKLDVDIDVLRDTIRAETT